MWHALPPDEKAHYEQRASQLRTAAAPQPMAQPTGCGCDPVATAHCPTDGRAGATNQSEQAQATDSQVVPSTPAVVHAAESQSDTADCTEGADQSSATDGGSSPVATSDHSVVPAKRRKRKLSTTIGGKLKRLKTFSKSARKAQAVVRGKSQDDDAGSEPEATSPQQPQPQVDSDESPGETTALAPSGNKLAGQKITVKTLDGKDAEGRVESVEGDR